ncbi:unnamed protein product [Ilex paraguariensis]|uniref:Uncharacterized protein n=1 Tax=Ilex paraguariensis TaxID=185542 RepID=A0ABC8UYS7_9AQUA
MEREKKKNNGKKLSHIQFFKIAYSKKDGRPINDVVPQALLQSDMDELVSQTSESSMQSSSAVDEVFTQVTGPERHGCVRAYGFGPSLRELFGHNKS